MLEKVKLALRISHNLLDADILETIATARAEMIRAGVDDAIANGDSDIINMAVKVYCLYIYSDASKVDGYFKAWTYMLDCIRKSTLTE